MIIKPLITRFEKQDLHFVAKHGFFRAARLVRAHSKKHKAPFIADTYQLAHELGIRRRELFGLTRHPEYHYRIITLRKQSGGLRVLHAPLSQMKHAQQRIQRRILAHLPVSPYATAYVRGKNLADNAAPHVGHKYLLKMDITDFFGSITYLQVISAAFPSTLYPPQIGAMLTGLCCYKEVLPQGAPTSPTLSNIVMRHFDDSIGGWCKQHGIAYTRYCDDLTFSADVPLYHVYVKVKDRLEKMGFTVNERKTHFVTAASRQTVTGLTVNEKVSIPADYKRELRQELHYAIKFGLADSIRRGYKPFWTMAKNPDVRRYYQHLMGKLNYVLQVEPQNHWFIQARNDLWQQYQDELYIR